ncbi:MAG: ABC transporter permease [Acidobacteriota bacterium]|jgi:predicted permease
MASTHSASPTARLYELSLRLLPTSYRHEYGAAMLDTFSLRLAAIDGGLAARLRLLLRELGGLLSLRWRERGGAGSSRHDAPGARPPRRSWLSGWGGELRHAAHRLRRAPAFTAATVLTLAVATGGNAAIFSVVHAILLAPLPYPDAGALVAVRSGAPSSGADDIEMTIGLYLHYRDQVPALHPIALYERAYHNLTADGEPARLETINATEDFFAVLAVEPSLGRVFGAADTAPDAEAVVVLSDRLWRTRYGADATIIGRSIILDQHPYTVVGVMPAGFDFPRPTTDAWVAWRIDPEAMRLMSFSYEAVARLADGATIESANAQITRALDTYPEAFGWERVEWDRLGLIGFVRPLRAQLVGDVGATLWLFAGAGLFVMLLACANVTNLFLVRSEARGAEARIRRALGASRAQLLRFWLAEGVCVATVAAALGLAIAIAGLDAIVRLAPDLPRIGDVRVGGATLLFTALLAACAALLFGTAPLLSGTTGGSAGLSSRRGVTAGAGARHGRELLVGAQVALALTLTIGAALMLQSVYNLMSADPGFDHAGVLTFRISLPTDGYPDREAAARFDELLVERLAALPGVESAGLARCMPLQSWCGGNPVSSPDSPLPPEGFRKVVSVMPVSSGYLEAAGIPLIAGRTFEPSDAVRRTGAAVINEALAARLFPAASPAEMIGKRVYPQAEPDVEQWLTVVGVVRAVQRTRIDEPAAEVLYTPLLGVSGDRHLPPVHDVTVAVRVAGDPLAALAPSRQVVRALDASLPIAGVQTLAEIHAAATARDRFSALLLTLAAGAGVLLGAIGIYGVVSWATRQRTAELGVRAALGARATDLLRMIMARGLAVIATGIAAGIAGSLLLNRVLEAMLYHVGARDPATFAGVAFLLVAIGTVATWLPARRAARIDPVEALRAR